MRDPIERSATEVQLNEALGELERYAARIQPVLDGRGPRASALLMQLDGLLRRQRSA